MVDVYSSIFSTDHNAKTPTAASLKSPGTTPARRTEGPTYQVLCEIFQGESSKHLILQDVIETLARYAKSGHVPAKSDHDLKILLAVGLALAEVGRL